RESGQVSTYDLKTYTKILDHWIHDAPINHLGYDQDTRIISCDTSNTVCIWDPRNGTILRINKPIIKTALTTDKEVKFECDNSLISEIHKKLSSKEQILLLQ